MLRYPFSKGEVLTTKPGNKTTSHTVPAVAKVESSDHDSMKWCVCQALHISCDPVLCIVSARCTSEPNSQPNLPIITTLIKLKETADGGCPTCAILYDGLCFTRMRYEWGGNDESEITIEDRDGKLQFGTLNLDYIPTKVNEMSCNAFALASPLSDNTISDQSFAQISSWIHQCDMEHTHCTVNQLSSLPFRVVVVEDSVRGQPGKIYLYETQGEHARYMTLSYCWGKHPSYVTTRNTLASRKNGIDWRELPKTFQDFIIIARILRIRYIWVDALCIIQDDKSDWETQSANMGTIYRNSYLTVSASHAANSSGGCFADTPALGGQTAHAIMMRQSLGSNYVNSNRGLSQSAAYNPQFSNMSIRHALDHSFFQYRAVLNGFIDLGDIEPLHRRGWCFQERLLSKRIVHYTARELIWECNSTTDCQCGRIKGMTQGYKLSLESSLQKLYRAPELTAQWMHIVEDYTERALTFESDRLPALSGLAKTFQEAGTGDYLAGLWSTDLLQLMMWKPREIVGVPVPARSRTYRGPTWSWVSVETQIYFPVYANHDERWNPVNLIEASCTPATLDPTGSVSSGYVRVMAQP